MAIFHLSVSICGRSNGQSAVASSAYISGECLVDQETGKRCDYRYKKEVVYSDVILPQNAPPDFKDRSVLWNEVQREEKGKTARFARKIDAAIPIEVSDRQMQINLVKDFAKKFTDEGMCVDMAIHDSGNGNPHIHLMLTTRAFRDDGTWAPKTATRFVTDDNGDRIPLLDRNGNQKVDRRDGCPQWKRETVDTVDWNKQEKIEEWRDSWEKTCNRYLNDIDAGVTIDHRSYARQAADLGIEPMIPTIHEGAAARRMEASGKVSDRIEINRMIIEHRRVVDRIRDLAVEIKNLITQKFKSLFDLTEETYHDEKIDRGIDSAARRGNPVSTYAGNRIDADIEQEERFAARRIRADFIRHRVENAEFDFEISSAESGGIGEEKGRDRAEGSVDRERDPVAREEIERDSEGFKIDEGL